MTNRDWQSLFLQRLEEIREYEWNDHAWMLFGESVNPGEGVLQAVARHMAEVVYAEFKRTEGPGDGNERDD